MKKMALGVALSACLVSSGAMAASQRPSYMAFSAPRAVTNEGGAAATLPAPAAPTVAKRAKALGSIPLYIPLIGGVTIVSLVAVLASGGGNNGSPG